MAARKVLLLGILLLLPVIAFLFLQSFGRNAYKLRTYLPEPMATAQVGAQPVSASSTSTAAEGDTVFHRVRDELTLTTSAGQTFNPAQDLRGRLVVLGFGQDSCTMPACRALLRGLARVQERYHKKPEVKLLTVWSIAYRTLPLLAERNGAISGKWIFATATAADVTALRAELRETAATAGPDRIWLLDQQRHVRGIYDALNPREIDRLLTEIDVLQQIEQNPVRP
jgi:protein SCO1